MNNHYKAKRQKYCNFRYVIQPIETLMLQSITCMNFNNNKYILTLTRLWQALYKNVFNREMYITFLINGLRFCSVLSLLDAEGIHGWIDVRGDLLSASNQLNFRVTAMCRMFFFKWPLNFEWSVFSLKEYLTTMTSWLHSHFEISIDTNIEIRLD